MTTTDVLQMPVPLNEGPHLDAWLDAWLAAFRAFDIDPSTIHSGPDARVPTITLELDGNVHLDVDLDTLDGDGTPCVQRIRITRPAHVVAGEIGDIV